MTLLPLRQRVQTSARPGEPFSSMRTRCRLGSKRRFVATIEWERWLPNAGCFPQTAQTFDMTRGSVAELLLGAGPEPGKEVGHLERRADGVGRLRDPSLGLSHCVDRQDAEGNRDAGLDRGQLKARGALLRDVVEM